MGDVIKEKQKIAVMVEATEGTYQAPASGSDYVMALSDGIEITPSKELLDRSVMDGNVGRVTPRQGMSSIAGSIGFEFKAGNSEGVAPESSPLYKAAFGAERTFATINVSDTDSGGTHTASKAYLDDGAGGIKVGDIVTIKVGAAFHTTPVTVVSTTVGDSYIEVLVANPSGAFVNAQTIAAGVTYLTANEGHPSLSVSKYLQDAVLESGSGFRATSMSLNNFSAGQMADVSFGLEGMAFNRSVTASPYTPSFDSSFPTVILKACVYQDGVLIKVSDAAISLENSIAWKRTTCSENGRLSGAIATRTVSGSFTPYKADDNVDMFNKFNNTTEFSVFLTAHVPTGTAGEYDQVCSVYLPKCIITELGETDDNGYLQDAVSFAATRGTTSDSEEAYITFS